eukprot:376240-Alexandrium_andersonii.AAC.1
MPPTSWATESGARPRRAAAEGADAKAAARPAGEGAGPGGPPWGEGARARQPERPSAAPLPSQESTTG